MNVLHEIEQALQWLCQQPLSRQQIVGEQLGLTESELRHLLGRPLPFGRRLPPFSLVSKLLVLGVCQQHGFAPAAPADQLPLPQVEQRIRVRMNQLSGLKDAGHYVDYIDQKAGLKLMDLLLEGGYLRRTIEANVGLDEFIFTYSLTL